MIPMIPGTYNGQSRKAENKGKDEGKLMNEKLGLWTEPRVRSLIIDQLI